jgi:hypothetical protein
MSRNPVGLYGLLQGQLYIILSTLQKKVLRCSEIPTAASEPARNISRGNIPDLEHYPISLCGKKTQFFCNS